MAISEIENFTDHYRRYININDLSNKIQSKCFKIDYLIEGTNLAHIKMKTLLL